MTASGGAPSLHEEDYEERYGIPEDKNKNADKEMAILQKAWGLLQETILFLKRAARRSQEPGGAWLSFLDY